MSYLEIKAISKSIRGDVVLKNVSLKANKGEIVGLVGENGSGKTMLMRAILGLLLPDVGEVLVGGVSIGKDAEFPPSCGCLIEAPSLIQRLSGFENLSLVAQIEKKIDRDEILSILDRVGLSDVQKKAVRAYSLGMRQRLGLAMACMEKPDLIVLDEPTNALDEDGVAILKELLIEQKQRTACCVISSHDKDFIEDVCDKIYVMKYGSIVVDD